MRAREGCDRQAFSGSRRLHILARAGKALCICRGSVYRMKSLGRIWRSAARVGVQPRPKEAWPFARLLSRTMLLLAGQG